jgi:hypothetical protein
MYSSINKAKKKKNNNRNILLTRLLKSRRKKCRLDKPQYLIESTTCMPNCRSQRPLPMVTSTGTFASMIFSETFATSSVPLRPIPCLPMSRWRNTRSSRTLRRRRRLSSDAPRTKEACEPIRRARSPDTPSGGSRRDHRPMRWAHGSGRKVELGAASRYR